MNGTAVRAAHAPDVWWGFLNMADLGFLFLAANETSTLANSLNYISCFKNSELLIF